MASGLISGSGESLNLDRPTPSRSSPTLRLLWCRLSSPFSSRSAFAAKFRLIGFLRAMFLPKVKRRI